ncbi:hypothetical protein Y1Q_0001587 [Alligator mississippiensis]|uniref:Uncharacterized protein n=1 Tax=Alligator mississippiensis TaxID=8496 RepID=A0A151MA13_ALLMI|nr:hypothetical protein Y1Q_0001587 [Alligator mississippiensis]
MEKAFEYISSQAVLCSTSESADVNSGQMAVFPCAQTCVGCTQTIANYCQEATPCVLSFEMACTFFETNLATCWGFFYSKGLSNFYAW